MSPKTRNILLASLGVGLVVVACIALSKKQKESAMKIGTDGHLVVDRGGFLSFAKEGGDGGEPINIDESTIGE